MNESFGKMDFGFLPERMPKTTWKRGHIGNSQEKEMAPISLGQSALVIFDYFDGRKQTSEKPERKCRNCGSLNSQIFWSTPQ